MVNSVNNCSFKGMEEFANQYNHTINPMIQTPSKSDLPSDSVEINQPADEPAKQNAAPADVAEQDGKTAEQPEQKRSFFQKSRDFYAGFKKSIIASVEYGKGVVKGAIAGAIGAVAVLGVDAIRNTVNHAPKTFSGKGKVVAGAVATVAMGVNIFKSYLNANQRKAEVDHRWRTGHDA